MSYIQTNLLPPAQNLLQAALKVRRLTTNITMASTDTCGGALVVPTWMQTSGVAADLIIFVTTSYEPASSYVAVAGACYLSTSSSSPYR